MKNFLVYWFPACGYMGFIFYLSSRSSFPVETPDWLLFDKMVHTCLFAGLALCYLWGLVKGKFSSITLRTFWITVVLTSAYGIFDEFHQILTPKRSSDIFDWIADTLGAILVCSFFYWRKSRISKKLTAIESSHSA